MNPPRKPRKPPVPDSEAELFRQAVGDVRPVTDRRVLNRPPPPSPKPRFREADEAAVLRDMMSDAFEPADVETGEELLFSRPGLQRRVLRRLRRGEFAVTWSCDLHGLTVPEARAALARFLHEARAGGHRCVRVIHGKGLGSPQRIPVLKTKVNRWLRQRDEVLAFCSAQPADGGTGALYVLLKTAS